MDKRASVAAPLLTQIMQFYNHTLRSYNPNCIVARHNVCTLLTVDFDTLGRAASSDGVESMIEARRALASWAGPASA